MENEKVKEVHGWRCNYCGKIYPTKDEAEKCWDRHITFEMEPVFEIGEEFPTMIFVKKIEGSRYTEIGTYPLKKKEKVDIPRKGGED
ncbi:MAG: hypothetical protein DRJ03_15440 [Chloroflexi bacterium]|nr:MAG: hypothetical protein DRJ03_15440 [Chloroflexota bacterium]